MRDLDWRAVARGALVAVAIALPAGLLQNFVVETGTPLSLLLLAVVVLGLAAGGYTAGRRQPSLALTAGGCATGGAYLAIQTLGVIRRVAQGESVSWLGIAFTLLLSVCIGVLGGFVAYRRSASSGGARQQTAA